MRRSQLFLARFVVTILPVVFAVTGCGGGGGGGDETPAELIYSGNSSPAALTTANATRLLGHVIGGSALSGEVPTGVVTMAPKGQAPGIVQLTRLLDDIIGYPIGHVGASQNLPAAIDINLREPCYPTGSAQPSGWVTYSGTLSDSNGTGTITIDFDECRSEDTYLDGTIDWRIDDALLMGDEWSPTDSTFTFRVITLISPDFNVRMAGTLREVIGVNITQTFNFVIQDRVSGRMQKSENLVMVFSAASYPYYGYQTISGRLYDSIDGYIDIATPQALAYESIDSTFPARGQLLLTCAANARLRMTALSSVLAAIALDIDNNGVYEVSGEIPFAVVAEAGSDAGDADGDGLPDSWEATHGLSNTTYADASGDTDSDGLSSYEEYQLGTNPTLVDSDVDGMPDGWEVTYGFNPLNPGDATQDYDSDVATNLQEHQYGTDPTNAGSTPVDLAVVKTVSLATVSAQTLFEYRITVSNQGPGLARGVTLTENLPAGAEVYTVVPGVFPAAWECSFISPGSLECQPMTVTFAPGEEVTIVVPVIAPAASGEISGSATITSATHEIDSVDNSATVNTTVATPVLAQVDVERDGVGGITDLERPFRLAISPDGAHVYVPAIVEDAIVVFARNPATGALTFVEAERGGLDTPDQPDFPKAVTVSPDGNHVYVVTEWEGALVVYARDSSTGELTYIEEHLDGVAGVEGLAAAMALTVSANGEQVYVAGAGDSAIAVFNRDTGTGQLTFSMAIVDGVGGVDGLAGAFDVALSPDNAYLYAAGSLDSAIAIFSRDPGSGALTYVGAQTGVSGPQSLAISGDGAYMYAIVSEGVSVFSRDTGSGALMHVATYTDGDDDIVGMEGMYNLAIAPDGGYVYVAAQYDSALGVFARDAVTGTLRFIEVQKDGIGSADGLGVAWALAVSPDSGFVYVSASGDNAVSAFSVDLGAVR